MLTEIPDRHEPPSESAFDVLTVFARCTHWWASCRGSARQLRGKRSAWARSERMPVRRSSPACFGVRELALAAGLQSPEPGVRKAVLRAGLVVDGADIVASIIALRKGAPTWIWLTFVAGASTFIGLGIGGLAKEEPMSPT